MFSKVFITHECGATTRNLCLYVGYMKEAQTSFEWTEWTSLLHIISWKSKCVLCRRSMVTEVLRNIRATFGAILVAFLRFYRSCNLRSAHYWKLCLCTSSFFFLLAVQYANFWLVFRWFLHYVRSYECWFLLKHHLLQLRCVLRETVFKISRFQSYKTFVIVF